MLKVKKYHLDVVEAMKPSCPLRHKAQHASNSPFVSHPQLFSQHLFHCC